MFIPILLYGLAMGYAYRWLSMRIRQRELAVALVSAIFWMALYLYEKSWIKMLGDAGTLLIVLGGGALLVDRYLAKRATSST